MKSKKLKLIIVGLLFLAMILLSFGTLFTTSNPTTNQNLANQNIQSQNQENQNATNQSSSTTLKNTTQNAERLILFYGQGCPHCANVEAYLKSNPPKFNLEQKEVYYNQNNQKDLISRAKSCGIADNQIGVPFLWTGKDCIVGDEPIINYFKNLNNNL